MNAAYLHVASNHIPVIAMPLAFVVLAYGVVRKNLEITRLGFGIVIATALITIFVNLTGDPAEHVILGLQGIQRADIHAHEEAAEAVFAATEVVGALALLSLWLTRKGFYSKPAALLVLFGSLLTSVGFAKVAHLGGLIRHSEIRSGTELVNVPTGAPEDANHALPEEKD